MIDISLYRSRIGGFNLSGRRDGKTGRKLSNDFSSCFLKSIQFLYRDSADGSVSIVTARGFEQVCYPLRILFSYLYLVLLVLLLSLNISFGGLSLTSTVCNCWDGSFSNVGMSFLGMYHVKVAYFCLISHVLLKKRHILVDQLFKCPKKRFNRYLMIIIASLMLINFMLIGICNPSMLNPGPNSLTIGYQNVRGLIPFSHLSKTHPQLDHTKIFELNAYIEAKKPDIIMLNETWLKKSIKDREIIENQGYDVYRNDRSQVTHPADPNNPNKFKKSGGGVLIAVRSNIDANIKRVSLRKGAEILAIEITVGENKYIFCTAYRVGTLGELNHESIVNSIKSFYSCRNLRKIFIVGDFNLSTVSWPLSDDLSSLNGVDKLFVDSFSELGLTQCVDVPTHYKGKTLDILLTNCCSVISDVKVHHGETICKSDHYPISFSVKVNTKNKKFPKRKIYNFKKANWDQLNEDLGRVPWHALVDRTEPNIAWLNFKTVLFTLVDKYIPKITIKCNFSSPWFDSECFSAYRAKERAHKMFKEANSLSRELKRDSTRRNFRQVCNTKMRDNLYNSDDPMLITKKFWSHIKSNSKSHRLPECMYLNDTYRCLPQEKANLFNSFFFDQFSAASNYDVDIDWSNDMDFDIEFNTDRIKNLLSCINSNKACGPDGIHGRILKQCAVSLARPLSLMFKTSFNSGIVPGDWKVANVVPVFKKGSKNNIENYRPISLTSLVMKTFERILKDELLIRTSYLLDERQHGFLNLRSCTTNMVNFTDSVVLSINDTKTLSTDVVYFDFSKAFDSVNHDLILKKLKEIYGIEGRFLKFIKNYLCEREQSVVIENCKSSSKPVLSGVPQGSILGPILFVLFINDLPLGLNQGTNLALYADDTKIWRPITCDLDHQILQSDIDYLQNWALENKMKFHLTKCKVVSIHRRPSPLEHILPCIKYYYNLGENPLDFADNETDLGVIINPNFNFDEQCESILSKANMQLGLVRRTCHFVKDVKRRRALFLSLVRSQFEHCSTVWRPCNETMVKKFERFQQKCIKWILSEEELSYSSSDNIYFQKCKQVNIFPLVLKFDFNDLILMHKVINGYIPVSLPEYLTWYNGNSRLRSSHLDRLSLVCTLLPKASSSKPLEKSFFYRTHSSWNSLPLEIREIDSISLFKSKLEDHLWKSIQLSSIDNADPPD